MIRYRMNVPATLGVDVLLDGLLETVLDDQFGSQFDLQ
jgi:hypothetical protein